MTQDRGSRWKTGALGLALTLSVGMTARSEDPPIAEYYGFQPLEIYKLHERISNLITANLDGDKIDDIAVANNAQSRIDLLLSTPGTSSGPTPSGANQVISSRRMRLSSVPVNKEVVSLATGDFDHDGKTDLAFYGTPAEIVVLKGKGAGQFEEWRRIPVGEAVESQTSLAAGDLNRDGRDDLVLLLPGELVTILQTADGHLGDPDRVAHTAARPGNFKMVDLDGDGGNDLVLLDSGSEDPIRVRFSTKGGQLGPEQRFALDTPRAISFGNVDGQPGDELLVVEGQSGRVRVLKLAEGGDDEAARRGRLLFFPLPSGDSRGRALTLGDVNGDHKSDVVVTDPANAQILLYLQEEGGLVRGLPFPSLAGTRQATVADLDGDGKGEVIVLSEQEKQIGLSRFQDGRLSFPAPLPISGEPVTLQSADLDADKGQEVLYISRIKGAGFELRGVKAGANGQFVPFRWGDAEAVPIPGLTGTPPALKVLDVNRDGRPDLLIFKPLGAPILLLGQPDGKPFQPASGNLGPLVEATPSGLSTAAPSDAALLVAQKTFARSVLLGPDGQWEVKDQFNAGRGGAQIIGAATLDFDGDGTSEVVLLDRASKRLLLLDKRDEVYRPIGSLSVGSFDFQGMHVADLDGDGRPDLLLAGTDKFGVVLTGRKGLRFESLADYETTRQDALLGDLIEADFNGDGRPDIAVSDIGEHSMEILNYGGPGKLTRGLAFKIFEKKSFRDRNSLVEPRDMAVGDVDGDGRTDLILICHDRVLVYRQDSGATAAEAKPAGEPGNSAGASE